VKLNGENESMFVKKNIMKTLIKTPVILFAILGLTTLSCKKKKIEEESSTNQQVVVKDHLNTPSWIRFTWTKPNGLNGEDGFKFTNDDMFTVMFDQNGNQTANLSYLESLKNDDYSINETTTDSSYQFSVHYNSTNSTESWLFNLLPNNVLHYTDNMNSVFVYNKKN
jgi:hypothetical protein